MLFTPAALRKVDGGFAAVAVFVFGALAGVDDDEEEKELFLFECLR